MGNKNFNLLSQRRQFLLPLSAGRDASQQTMAVDLVMSDKLTSQSAVGFGNGVKLTSQSAVSFGHFVKTSRNPTCDVTSTTLEKWWKLRRQATLRYIKNALNNLHGPSLISVMVSVDVKHHVYLLNLHGKRRDLGSNQLRLSSLFRKLWSVDTVL